MKEFIDKLIARLEEMRTMELDMIGSYCQSTISKSISIVNELAEEYRQDTTFQYVLLQTDIMKRMGIDVSCKWETATQQASALNKAYIRGRQDERDRFAEWQDEYNGGWIPVSERLPNKEEYLKDDGRFIVTDGNRRYQSIYNIYEGGFRTLKLFANGGSERGWNFEEDNCVIAWQPLPQPYQPKGE